MIISDDVTAWHVYPQHRIWFNKLWLSENLGYSCGPGGVSVSKTATYIVRPVYNLRGMGLGAELKHLTPVDIASVPPGYFWCEQFTGIQYSVDYHWNLGWQQLSAFEGYNQQDCLYQFYSWKKSTDKITLPKMFDVLQDCKYINVEFIGNKVIEVHLRVSPDPNTYTHLIPVWKNQPTEQPPDYTWIASYDDADGLLPNARLGFYSK